MPATTKLDTTSLPVLQHQPSLSVTSQTQATVIPIPTPAPLSQLLQSGLSPVFDTDCPASFYRFLQYISAASVCALPPSGVLTAGVLTLAVSYPCTPSLSATSNVLLTPSVIANISIAVPAFAKHYGYNRFQIWLDVSLFHHRRMHPRFHYCTRRIVPFLSLPVLHVPAAHTDQFASNHHDFRTSLQALAASLGRGRFVATFTSNSAFDSAAASSSVHSLPSPSSSSHTVAKPAVIFHYDSCDGRRDSLRTRFDALVFAVIATRLLQLPGVCPTERDFFRVAASNAFSSTHSLRMLTPPSSQHLRNSVIWTPAAFVNPLHLLRALSQCNHSSLSSSSSSSTMSSSSSSSSTRAHTASTKISLRDVIYAWSSPNVPEAAARRLRICRKSGEIYHWVVVCADASGPSVAVVMELADAVASAETTPSVSTDSECAYHSQSKINAPNTPLHQSASHDVLNVARSCMCVLDEPTEFLDLTSEIAQSLSSQNEPLRVAVEDMLVDCGVLEDGESVSDAAFLQISEEMASSTITSPCSDTLVY